MTLDIQERAIRWNKERYEKIRKMSKRIEELRKLYPYTPSLPQRQVKRNKRRYISTPSQAKLVF